ncbi:zinc dependent phospholipase C family protein [Hymenobacter sp. ISL-91]|uniref:zinc dependent phospholipase C family protein n=1 Tax=Hymenobacter sp. ISL-91 TaxID=2819151 RepID=UPI001BE8DD3C|nr:zinc dependent phospholipase C family protein [Hymenobacter sp. ISL-91]MBT2556599.1 zinc dependent phospholipase C family protein [Hymenobacter sp. ISL-91]
MMKWYFCAALLLAGLVVSGPTAAYSVLTHQANVDSTWKPCILPLLQSHYPGATEEELLGAKAYAYGGSILQDMGYYPFGSELFTNLTHYVRSGDFVRNLLSEARNRNEYAFALGALAHYAADINGHPAGTNKAMASVYPELKAKFGDAITYEEAPIQHTQLEFAFDVVQMASGRYRSADYQRYIGFKVGKEVLERAFLKTYGLELGQVIVNVDLAIGSFRFAVRSLIPIASRAAWQSKKNEIRKEIPQARRREYVYKDSQQEYEKTYGTEYEHPGLGARILSYFVRVLPKIGPLKPFAFKLPTPEAQSLFKASFRQVMKHYCGLLEKQPRDTVAAPPMLANTDFDTGRPAKPGAYSLTDVTYGEWLQKLADQKFEHLTAAHKQNLLAFYKDPSLPATNNDKGEDREKDAEKRKMEAEKVRAKISEALQLLRAATPIQETRP